MMASATAVFGRVARVLDAEILRGEAEYACRMGRLDINEPGYRGAQGIAWALGTGRLPGALAMAIERRTKGAALWRLAERAGRSCPTMGDVPRWLIAHESEIVAAAGAAR